MTTAGVARWKQIADALRQDVSAGRLQPGERLPAEPLLAGRFGVNRHTVRRAVEELSRAGLVRVEQGRGSFVTPDVLDYVVAPRTRFSEWIRRHNREPSGRVLDLRTEVAGEALASSLHIAPGDTVIVMERLGLADGRPVSLGTHHFPAAQLPGLLDALREEGGISSALARVGAGDYQRQSTRVSARMPTEVEAQLLQTAPGLPLLVCDNTNVDRTGRVIEFCVARHPTPRVQVVFEPDARPAENVTGF